MALFELAAVAGGALVGNQWPRVVSTVRGTPSRQSTGKETLVRTGAGAIAGLGLATKSLALTGAGAGAVVFSRQVSQLLRITGKASAQQALVPAVKTIGPPNLRAVAKRDIGLRPPKEPGMLIGQKVEFQRGRTRVPTKPFRIPALNKPPPPEAVLTKAAAQLFRERNLVLEGNPPISRAQKLGMVTRDIKIGRSTTRKLRSGRRRPKRRRRSNRGVPRTPPLSAVISEGFRPAGLSAGVRLDHIRRPAFG